MAEASYGGNYVKGADPRLVAILQAAAAAQGLGVRFDSGYRAGDPRFHGKKMATDVQLIDPVTGKDIPDYQSAKSFRTYEQFAQLARQIQRRDYPELDSQFRWGGYFSGAKGKYGALDLMHFDLGGDRVPMAGGSWEKGLTKAQRKQFPGVESVGFNDHPVPKGYIPDVGTELSVDAYAAPMPQVMTASLKDQRTNAAMDAINGAIAPLPRRDPRQFDPVKSFGNDSLATMPNLPWRGGETDTPARVAGLTPSSVLNASASTIPPGYNPSVPSAQRAPEPPPVARPALLNPGGMRPLVADAGPAQPGAPRYDARPHLASTSASPLESAKAKLAAAKTGQGRPEVPGSNTSRVNVGARPEGPAAGMPAAKPQPLVTARPETIGTLPAAKPQSIFAARPEGPAAGMPAADPRYAMATPDRATQNANMKGRGQPTPGVIKTADALAGSTQLPHNVRPAVLDTPGMRLPALETPAKPATFPERVGVIPSNGSRQPAPQVAAGNTLVAPTPATMSSNMATLRSSPSTAPKGNTLTASVKTGEQLFQAGGYLYRRGSDGQMEKVGKVANNNTLSGGSSGGGNSLMSLTS